METCLLLLSRPHSLGAGCHNACPVVRLPRPRLAASSDVLHPRTSRHKGRTMGRGTQGLRDREGRARPDNPGGDDPAMGPFGPPFTRTDPRGRPPQQHGPTDSPGAVRPLLRIVKLCRAISPGKTGICRLLMDRVIDRSDRATGRAVQLPKLTALPSL
jgi:hypothetical protein